MDRKFKRVWRFLRREGGVTGIEMALMTILIVIVASVGIAFFGEDTQKLGV